LDKTVFTDIEKEEEVKEKDHDFYFNS